MSRPTYGRYQVAEAPHSINDLVTWNTGTPLKEVTHDVGIGVLDQSDLEAQGIDTSTLVAGAPKVDALGSCTANANMSALAELYNRAGHLQAFLQWAEATAAMDTVGIEKAAIKFYAECTHQTGDPSQEWPAVDCGSSGQYVVKENQTLKLCVGANIAAAGQALVALLQDGGVLMGSPFFYSWEQPGANGIIDGDGSLQSLQQAVHSGLAGGHETFLFGVDTLVLEVGRVVPEETILLGRNSWSETWGDAGCYRIHLSTLVNLATHCDFRQLR